MSAKQTPSDAEYLLFGKRMLDTIMALGDVVEVTGEQLRSYEQVNGYVEVWKKQKAEIDLLRSSHAELLAALTHMRCCQACAEGSWEDCEGGQDALAAIARATEQESEKP